MTLDGSNLIPKSLNKKKCVPLSLKKKSRHSFVFFHFHVFYFGTWTGTMLERSPRVADERRDPWMITTNSQDLRVLNT